MRTGRGSRRPQRRKTGSIQRGDQGWTKMEELLRMVEMRGRDLYGPSSIFRSRAKRKKRISLP